jgi:hypothetical protein
MSNGVDLVLARMESHPEEFYTSSNEKWKFIYTEYFRDAMTETEKGQIFDKIKEIRKAEFTAKVMATLTEGMKMGNRNKPKSSEASFAEACVLPEGSSIGYDASTGSYLKYDEEE